MTFIPLSQLSRAQRARLIDPRPPEPEEIDECTLAEDDGELFVTPQAPRVVFYSPKRERPWDAMEAQAEYRRNE